MDTLSQVDQQPFFNVLTTILCLPRHMQLLNQPYFQVAALYSVS